MRDLLVLALVACGSSHAPVPSPQPSSKASAASSKTSVAATQAPADAGGAVQADCPASYADAHGTCPQTKYSSWCTYPEGDCGCTYDVPEHCGGARVPPPKPGTPTVWKCTPKPSEFRADGCPGARPNGRACSSEGKVCTYQTCCFFQYTCTGGQWTETAGACPP